jgi:hypothetical protein
MDLNKEGLPEALSFSVAYLIIILFVIIRVIIDILPKKKDVWIYGTCNNLHARKNKRKGNVQMKLWKAGEQGHKEDYWHNFDSSWWNQFEPNKQ